MLVQNSPPMKISVISAIMYQKLNRSVILTIPIHLKFSVIYFSGVVVNMLDCNTVVNGLCYYVHF